MNMLQILAYYDRFCNLKENRKYTNVIMEIRNASVKKFTEKLDVRIRLDCTDAKIRISFYIFRYWNLFTK